MKYEWVNKILPWVTFVRIFLNSQNYLCRNNSCYNMLHNSRSSNPVIDWYHLDLPVKLSYISITFNPIVIITILKPCWMLSLKYDPSSISVMKDVDFKKFGNQSIINHSRLSSIALYFAIKDNLQSLPWYKNACKKGIFDAQSFVDKPDFEWNTCFVICWEESQGYKIRITCILDIGFINVRHKNDF